MERVTLKEFKEQSNMEIIESIMKMNNGYVTSKELSNLGIKFGTFKCNLFTYDCTLFSWTFY